MLRTWPFLLPTLASFVADPAFAASPDGNYMRSDRYPAQVTAVDYAKRRVTATQAMAMGDWLVTLKAQGVSEWQDNVGPNQLRNRRAVWVPAQCRRDGEPRGQRCGFRFVQVVEMARPRTHCYFAVFDVDSGRWQRSEIGCPSALKLEPAPPGPMEPGLGSPGSRRYRTS